MARALAIGLASAGGAAAAEMPWLDLTQRCLASMEAGVPDTLRGLGPVEMKTGSNKMSFKMALEEVGPRASVRFEGIDFGEDLGVGYTCSLGWRDAEPERFETALAEISDWAHAEGFRDQDAPNFRLRMLRCDETQARYITAVAYRVNLESYPSDQQECEQF